MNSVPTNGVQLHKIDSSNRLRKALPVRVEALAEDIDERGLLTPIEVVGPLEDGGYRLVYGAHRLAAAKLLGWESIPAFVHAPDAFASTAEEQLREIRENLMRFELNALERAVAVAAWRDIYEAAHGKVARGGDRRKKPVEESLDDQSAKFALCFSEAAQAAFELSGRAIYLALKIATLPQEIRDRIAELASRRPQEDRAGRRRSGGPVMSDDAKRARKPAGFVMQAHLRRWRLRESLLERALAELRGELASMVETTCELAWDGMDHTPVPGTAEVEAGSTIADRVQLIRDIEAEIGRPVEHPEPQWLDDLLDGKWGLS